MLKVLYAVVDRAGRFRRDGNGPVFVRMRRKAAEKFATRDGDSVVELVWDTDREPLHIKRRKVKVEDGAA